MARKTAQKPAAATDLDVAAPEAAGHGVAPGLPVRVKSRYTVRGGGETVRSFDVVIPAEKLETLGTELEIFTLYDLVFGLINASSEVMLSHAEIVSATVDAEGAQPA